MAIKKRSLPVDRSADIEAFGNGALPDDQSHPSVREIPAKEPSASDLTTPVEGPSVSRQLLVRFPSDDLPRALEELAARDDRSKHYMALAALKIGIAHLQGLNR